MLYISFDYRVCEVMFNNKITMWTLNFHDMFLLKWQYSSVTLEKKRQFVKTKSGMGVKLLIGRYDEEP